MTRPDIKKDMQFFPGQRKMYVVKNDSGTERIQSASETVQDLKADTETTIGFYSFSETTGKWTSVNAGAGAPAEFKIYWHPGTLADGVTVELEDSPKLTTTNLKVSKAAYSAGQRQINHIGYSPSNTAGVLGYTTVAAGDELILRIYDETEASEPYDAALPFQVVANEIEALNDDVYSMLSRLVAQVSNDADFHYKGNNNKRLFYADVITAATNGTNFANSATVAAVKGATSLTTSANHGVGVGDYFHLEGVLYKAQAGTATTTLVLDRPYAGATATIANDDAHDIGATVPTELGIMVTSEEIGTVFSLATTGEWSGATHTDVQPYALPSNSIEVLQKMEIMSNIRRGYLDINQMATRFYPAPNNFIDPTKFYTVYFIDDKKTSEDRWDKFDVKFAIAIEQDDSSTANTSLDTFFGL